MCGLSVICSLYMYAARRRTFVQGRHKKYQKWLSIPPVHQNLAQHAERNGLFPLTPTGVVCQHVCGTRAANQPNQHGFGHRSRASSAPRPSSCFPSLLRASWYSCPGCYPGLMPVNASPLPHPAPFSASRISCWLRCCARTHLTGLALPNSRIGGVFFLAPYLVNIPPGQNKSLTSRAQVVT